MTAPFPRDDAFKKVLAWWAVPHMRKIVDTTCQRGAIRSKPSIISCRWERFRAVLTPDELKKSSPGRKPFDAILMFRMLVLQALNNLSDEQVEYQVRDRLLFSRFLGLAIEDSIPDATTLWLFREKLARAGLIEQLFDRFDQHLAAKGYMARGGMGAHQQGGSRSPPKYGRRAGPRRSSPRRRSLATRSGPVPTAS